MNKFYKIRQYLFFRFAIFFFTAILLTFSQIISAYAEPLKIIRDQEIEDVLKKISSPMFEKAGFHKEDINIIIVESYGINAFVAGGKNIFINTGLMLKTKNLEEILGVIAHELSHISSGHLLRTKSVMKNMSLQTLLITIAGMATSVLAGNSGAGAAILKGGQVAAISSFLKHSRAQESAADAGAVKYLEALGLSPKGMLSFMKTLQGQELLPVSQQSRYVRTHPLTRDRINFLQKVTKRSKYIDKKPRKDWEFAYDMVRAKLIGYIIPSRVLETPNITDSNYVSDYTRTIALYRTGQDKESLKLIDKLLDKNRDNPYLYELKGQILFEMGDIENATKAYKKAVTILPEAGLIQIAYAHALIEYANNIENKKQQNKILEQALAALQTAKIYEKHSSKLFRFLSIVYGTLGQEGLARLNLAEEAVMQNRLEDARRQLSYARRKLSPKAKQALIRVKDLEVFIEIREKDLKKISKKH